MLGVWAPGHGTRPRVLRTPLLPRPALLLPCSPPTLGRPQGHLPTGPGGAAGWLSGDILQAPQSSREAPEGGRPRPSPRRRARPADPRAYLRALLPCGPWCPLAFIQTLGQMLAHVGRGGQGPPQLVGLVGQGATQDVAGGPGPLLLRHAPAQQGHLLLPLKPRLAQEVLRLPLLLLQPLRESLNFLRGRFKSTTDLTVVPEKKDS